MPAKNMPVQKLKVAFLPLRLPFSGLVTPKAEILTTGKSHKMSGNRLPTIIKKKQRTKGQKNQEKR